MKETLFSKNYCCIVAANFLLYFGFWLLIPVLPMYLKDQFSCDTAIGSLVISCYTLSALLMRPFSGYLLDAFMRKPLYMLGYTLFVGIFASYLVAGSILLFAILRAIHGLAFGIVTVGGNTIVVDIMPGSRRGEGLGYYGMANNMAMAVGPMTGLMLHNNGADYSTIFTCGLIVCGTGLLMGSMLKTPYTPPKQRAHLQWNKIILTKGIPAGIALLLLSIPYGMTTNYIAMYAKGIGITAETGLFFTLTAFGMAVARIVAGRWVDKGFVTEIIERGFYGVIASFIAIAALDSTYHYNANLGTIVFFAIPVVMGLSFGIMFPAYNTVFVNLANKNQRGTATSTYLTSWDIGLGLGIVLGGSIAQHLSFSYAYTFGTGMAVIAAILFRLKVTPSYHKAVESKTND